MSIDEAPEPIPIIPDVPRALSPLVRRICADNPGVMTGPGTNTYLIGVDEIAVIDPGPADDHQVGACRQHCVGDIGGRSDDQRMRPAHRREEFVGRQTELHVDVVAEGTEAIEAPVGDFFGDQDASHGLMPI